MAAEGVRRLGAVLLALGAVIAGLSYPVVPEEPREILQVFRLDLSQCRELLETRGSTTLTCPEDVGPVTMREIARRYDLELSALCAANGLPETCGEERVEPGDERTLPLHRSRSDRSAPAGEAAP